MIEDDMIEDEVVLVTGADRGIRQPVLEPSTTTTHSTVQQDPGVAFHATPGFSTLALRLNNEAADEVTPKPMPAAHELCVDRADRGPTR
jgi:hypothetical protein